ncbi:MAG: YfdX family protein [Nitrospirae bacterium]|nr:YfdX family protein [Nitrospirota bacterium]
MKSLKRIFLGLLISSALLSSFFAFAADTTGIKQKAANKSAKEALAKAQKGVSKEAAAGVRLTYKALSLLRNKKADEAKSTLLEAAKNLNAVTKKGKDLLPVNVYIDMAVGVETPAKAKELIRGAKEALNTNDPQMARELLLPLVSEIDVSVENIPLVTYKDYIDNAVLSLKKGKEAKAGQTLLDAVGSLITETEVIPLPAVMAEALLDQANGVLKKNPKRALELIKDAKAQLELNKLLGYGQTKAFRKQAGSIRKKALSERFQEAKRRIAQKSETIKRRLKNDTSKTGKKIKGEVKKIENRIQH